MELHDQYLESLTQFAVLLAAATIWYHGRSDAAERAKTAIELPPRLYRLWLLARMLIVAALSLAVANFLPGSGPATRDLLFPAFSLLFVAARMLELAIWRNAPPSVVPAGRDQTWRP